VDAIVLGTYGAVGRCRSRVRPLQRQLTDLVQVKLELLRQLDQLLSPLIAATATFALNGC
jgi:hypothetical protein